MTNIAGARITTPQATYNCQVMNIKPLSAATFEVELRSPKPLTLDYRAGQYLQLKLDVYGDGQEHSLSYSIANSFDPEFPQRLQLFMQSHNTFADRILLRLQGLKSSNDAVRVKLPMGKAFLQTNLELPHLLVAAGSGISKIKCLTEEILKQKPNAKTKIYWSNRKVDEFYLLDQFQNWAKQHRNLTFTPVLEFESRSWCGRSGYLYQSIATDIADLSDTKAYLCGSPKMVYGTIDQLKKKGLAEQNCYSDVFEYSPRTEKQNISATDSVCLPA